MWYIFKRILMAFRVLFLATSRLLRFIFCVLKKFYNSWFQYQTVKYAVLPLSPLSRHRLSLVKRKTMIIDLDETLIHSYQERRPRHNVTPEAPADFILKVTIENRPVRFFVHKRPHVDLFLDVISQWFELVIFTASMEVYGALVADHLDADRNILRRRYFRQHCMCHFGSYTKDISVVRSDLSSVFLLDNSPGAYRAYPENGFPIKSWFCDPNDTALLSLLPLLDSLRFTNDVRSILGRNIQQYKL